MFNKAIVFALNKREILPRNKNKNILFKEAKVGEPQEIYKNKLFIIGN